MPVILKQCTVIGVNDAGIKLARTEKDEKGGGIAAIQHGLSEGRIVLQGGYFQRVVTVVEPADRRAVSIASLSLLQLPRQAAAA
jgi:hypothetical protein